ncbi:MAG: transglycosylase SLT domain-containing protein [Bacteroidota bacterium]
MHKFTRLLPILLILSVFLMSFDLTDGENETQGEGENTRTIREHKGKHLGIMSYLTCAMYDSLIVAGIPADNEHPGFSAEEAANNDSLIKARLRYLSESTEIPLEYHPSVKDYIKKYAIENPEKISAILGRKAYYYPIFSHYLNVHNLPPELSHLASVESALDPNAVSPSGAVGLWQFLPGSAGLFDLRMDAWIDERRDVHKSTLVACEYISYLYRIFNDWHLALAAYNGGPGAVEKAIARAGEKTNYWDIRPEMSAQMKIYVPAFIAMNYVLAYHQDFGIEAAVPLMHYHQTDTIHVKEKIFLDKVAEEINTDPAILTALNPVYRQKIIPKNSHGYPLILPRTGVIAFILKKQEIAGIKPAMLSGKEKSKTKITEYQVKRGDSLHKIAIRFNCTIEEIRQWNNLSRQDMLRYDQMLILYESEE